MSHKRPLSISEDQEAWAVGTRRVGDRLLKNVAGQDEFTLLLWWCATVEQLCMQCPVHEPILTHVKCLQHLFYLGYKWNQCQSIP